MSFAKPKAVFFDWDGTAVYSRKAPADEAINAMKPLLSQGISLVIVSGTTIENIAGGEVKNRFTPAELKNLYLGLGRGACNYAFDEGGKPVVFAHKLPEKKGLLAIHDICYEIHKKLLKDYDFPTDIVFSRPNYCKIDLMVANQRGDQLFLQENELALLKESLNRHGIEGGLHKLLEISHETGKKYGVDVAPTCDAKYLEVGISSKSDNVDTMLEKFEKEYGIQPKDCSFWGDEYVGIEEGIYGSDSFMITERSREAKFYDVSQVAGSRPKEVTVLGGGVERFLEYLREIK